MLDNLDELKDYFVGITETIKSFIDKLKDMDYGNVLGKVFPK